MPPDIRELIDPADLIGVVRQLQFPRFTLANFFPRRNVDAIDYSFAKGNEDNLSAAAMRAFDAEAQIGKRPGITRVTGQLPPISQKIPLTEGERLMLRALQTGRGDVPPELTDAIYADAARMVRSVEQRVELARGDALTDGIITIAENNLQFTIDFGVPANHKVVAAASWALAATDIVGDIESWTQTYTDTNGFAPARAVTSSRVIAFMTRNQGVRDLIGGIPTQETVNQLLEGSGLPRIERYDVQVRNAEGVSTRVIPDDRFIMLSGEDEVIGVSQYGVTAEALELANDGLLPAQDVPGVVAVNWRTKDPVQIWTKGAAIALPILANPAFVFAADVVP